MNPESNEDLPAIWLALSDVQRTWLAEDVYRKPGRWHGPIGSVSTVRALARRGLIRVGNPTPQARRLVDWAIKHDYLTRGADGEWHATAPAKVKANTKQRVADLAGQGLTVSEIAQELGRTRQAVAACCKRYGIQVTSARSAVDTLTSLRAEIAALRARIAELEGALTGPT